jgi:hypothetical protein
MEKNFVTALTAQNATETTKTLIDTYTVPLGVTKLIEVGIQISLAGFTTAECISAILELECDDSSNWGGTQQFVSDSVPALVPVTATVIPAKIHDCNIPVQSGSHIKFSTTFNTALTINPSVRCFGKFN